MLMVFFSSRISPLASTVIFCDRSPLATAVVTFGDVTHLGGQVGREAVDVVGQVLPGAAHALARSAWPPSLPSVPTSFATRVTSAAKEFSWSTILLMTSLIWRISPLTSTVIFCVRSPLAIAVATFETSRS